MSARDHLSEICDLYRSGWTLQQIGDRLGVTRERVRQIIAPHLSRDEGGQSVRAQKARDRIVAARAVKRDAKAMKMYGVPHAEAFEINGVRVLSRQGTPAQRYVHQKKNVKARGIAWDLTLREWWQIWRQSGKWRERGRGQGYCMARHLDRGPYAVGNVYICTCKQNASDSYIAHPAHERVAKRKARAAAIAG